MSKILIERAAVVSNLVNDKIYHQIIYCCSNYKQPFDSYEAAEKEMDALMKRHKENGNDMGGAYIYSYTEIEDIAQSPDEAIDKMNEMAQLIADQQKRIEELEADKKTIEDALYKEFCKEENSGKSFIERLKDR